MFAIRMIVSVSRFLRTCFFFSVFACAATGSLSLRDWGFPSVLALTPSSSSVRWKSPSTVYPLADLRVLQRVLAVLKEKYVEPERLSPKEMLRAALNAVQREVPQVLVHEEELGNKVQVRVDTHQELFRIDDVRTMQEAVARLRQIFVFLQTGLHGTEVNLRDVEYAACNGFLHKLDPHSTLLSPDQFKEMNVATRGHFGGLGLVVSLRDLQLTALSILPGTPAQRVGLKAYDQIVKIDGVYTLNMGLQEAVDCLRGPPGTPVTLEILRENTKGQVEQKSLSLTREVIHVVSVEHAMLEGHVGYIKIKQFQANTSGELDKALSTLHTQGPLRGLVLDLRGNPGGLLEEAIAVADRFVKSGPIVSMVGNTHFAKEVQSAHPAHTEREYPLFVLVDGSSASASEIVAGTLKNHDRAVIGGQATFGKGSVQLLVNDLPDGAALKFTMGQYLTEPGGVSIQGVGVTPDIEFLPMTVDTQEMSFTVDTRALKERDFKRRLVHATARAGQKPSARVGYFLSKEELADMRDRRMMPEESLVMDFPIRFAQAFVAQSFSSKRSVQVAQATAFLRQQAAEELGKVRTALSTLGVDWSLPSEAPPSVAASPSLLEVTVETDSPNHEVVAGGQLQLRVSVTNKGKLPVYRLAAVTQSDDPLFSKKELVFGKIGPGETRMVSSPFGWCESEGYKPGSKKRPSKEAKRICSIPRSTVARAEGVTVHFEEAYGRAPADESLYVTVRPLPRPAFAYTYQLADDRKGNGDGRIQKGEGCTLYLTVKNTGTGPSYETQAMLRNLSGAGVVLRAGRFDLSHMKPGEIRRAPFSFDVEPDFAESEVKVELSIVDTDLHESVSRKLRLPIQSPLTLRPLHTSMRVKVEGGAVLLSSADQEAHGFGRLPKGQIVRVLGQHEGYMKIALSPLRFAFVHAAHLEKSEQCASDEAVQIEEAVHTPPHLEGGPTLMATRESVLSVPFLAQDEKQILDVYAFVGAQKVFYQSNRAGVDARKVPFQVLLPLKPGLNFVTVIARESSEIQSHRSFLIRRDGPNGELLPTSKTLEDDALEMDDD